MNILKQAIIGVMWFEIIVVSVFLAGCALGVVMWGYSSWSNRWKA